MVPVKQGKFCTDVSRPPTKLRPYPPRYSGDSDFFAINQISKLKLWLSFDLKKNTSELTVMQNKSPKSPAIGKLIFNHMFVMVRHLVEGYQKQIVKMSLNSSQKVAGQVMRGNYAKLIYGNQAIQDRQSFESVESFRARQKPLTPEEENKKLKEADVVILKSMPRSKFISYLMFC